MPIITLLTDFGTRDHYVGAVKGVILQIAPSAALVDITHEIGAHDVTHAAFVLRRVWPWYPPGTIHVAIVDPGVGSARQVLIGKYASQYVIAPDNGLVSLVHREVPMEELRVVENRRYFLAQVSATFHGRDIMAPVAAHLANGVPLREFGPLTDRVEVLQLPAARIADDHSVLGRVVYVDRFGNLVTNISRDAVQSAMRHRPSVNVYIDEKSVGPIRNTYTESAAGQPLALIGSSDLLEIAVNRGNARKELGTGDDARVCVR